MSVCPEIWQKLPRNLVIYILQYVPHLAHFFDQRHKWIREYSILRKPILQHIRLNALHQFLRFVHNCEEYSVIMIIVKTHSKQRISQDYCRIYKKPLQFQSLEHEDMMLFFNYNVDEITLNDSKICRLDIGKYSIFIELCKDLYE